MSTCDNKSVGVIIKDRGRFAVIKRKNYPIAYAFVAGHLDGDSPRQAAIKEATQEAHISIDELGLQFKGRFSNPCKREGGSWHEWSVWEATKWHGNLKAGSDAKEVSWKSHDELRNLADRTRFFSKKFKIPLSNVAALTEKIVEDPDWRENPGFEPIWVILLERIGIV